MHGGGINVTVSDFIFIISVYRRNHIYIYNMFCLLSIGSCLMYKNLIMYHFTIHKIIPVVDEF